MLNIGANRDYNNMWPAMAKQGKSHNDKFLIRLFLSKTIIQDILEAMELPFNNHGLPWLL